MLETINGRNDNEVVALPEAHNEGDIAFNNCLEGKTTGTVLDELELITAYRKLYTACKSFIEAEEKGTVNDKTLIETLDSLSNIWITPDQRNRIMIES